MPIMNFVLIFDVFEKTSKILSFLLFLILIVFRFEVFLILLFYFFISTIILKNLIAINFV